MINNNPIKRASLFNSALTNWRNTGDGQADTWKRYHQETGEDPLVVYATVPSLGFAKAVPLPTQRPYAATGTYRFPVDRTYNNSDARWDVDKEDIVPLSFEELSEDRQSMWWLWAVWRHKAINNGLYWLPFGGKGNEPYTVW